MQGTRRLAADDWETLRRIRLRALREVPSAFASTFEEESRRPDSWWKRSIEEVAWFVFDENGEPIGLAGGLTVGRDQRFPELISMWVDDTHRRTQVADALLSAVSEWARSAGADRLSAWVSHGNLRARRFYERAGFVATGTRKAIRNGSEAQAEELRLML